ncbi:DUF2345 domain-containing protein, partial [uncultured Acinetobacter sp.]
TDQWGAVRAGKGLLLSTYTQDQAKGDHLDATPAKKQLEGSQNKSKALNDIAKNQKTDEIESVEQLKIFAQQLQQEIAKFNQAVLLLSSQDGIALSTPENIHLSADAQINQIAGDSINFSTQKNWIVHAKNKISLFSVMNGINIIAAQGKFNIHAQTNALDIFAKLGITISSTENRVEINSSKEVQITGKSSRITLNGAGILCETDRMFEVKSGQQKFEGGVHVLSTKISLPMPKTLYSNRIDYSWNDDIGNKKEIFVLDQNKNLIKFETDKLNEKKAISSLRFYTLHEAEFIALGFDSSNVSFMQKRLDGKNKDELLEEALFESSDNDVYTEEDF